MIYSQKLWEMVKPILIDYLKTKSDELKQEGFIPTIELLIEDLENN